MDLFFSISDQQQETPGIFVFSFPSVWMQVNVYHESAKLKSTVCKITAVKTIPTTTQRFYIYDFYIIPVYTDQWYSLTTPSPNNETLGNTL